MNEHDSEKVAGLLAHHGMVAVNSPEEADLFFAQYLQRPREGCPENVQPFGRNQEAKERTP